MIDPSIFYLEYNIESNEYWECWIRHLATTDHHPVGTCKMGTTENESESMVDRMAVVNYKTLKVKGLDNVRIVDASIMPKIPSKLIPTHLHMWTF